MKENNIESNNLKSQAQDNGINKADEMKDSYLGLGMLLGMLFGIAFGKLLFGNFTVGMSIGMLMGMTVGSSIKKKG